MEKEVHTPTPPPPQKKKNKQTNKNHHQNVPVEKQGCYLDYCSLP
jgi:hypothetical protein